MWLKRVLRTALLCGIVEVGCLSGLIMRPEDIEQLLRGHSMVKAEQTLSDEESERDGMKPEPIKRRKVRK
jgi:hypothetical protein